MKTFFYITLFACLFLKAQSQSITVHPRMAMDWYAKPYHMLFVLPANEEILVSSMGNFRIRSGGDILYKDRWGIAIDQHVYIRDFYKTSFRPANVLWDFKIFVRIAPKINISFSHGCWHPVRIYHNQFTEVYGGWNMLSVSYEY